MRQGKRIKKNEEYIPTFPFFNAFSLNFKWSEATKMLPLHVNLPGWRNW